jgi:hypothetical protein
MIAAARIPIRRGSIRKAGFGLELERIPLEVCIADRQGRVYALADASLTLVGQQETDTKPYTTYVATGPANGLSLRTSPNRGSGENDLFAVATGADGSTWAVGWDINTTTTNHDPLILHGKNGIWSLASSPSLGGSDSGFAAITAIPGGGLWAVGVTGNAKGNYATLIEYHP